MSPLFYLFSEIFQNMRAFLSTASSLNAAGCFAIVFLSLPLLKAEPGVSTCSALLAQLDPMPQLAEEVPLEAAPADSSISGLQAQGGSQGASKDQANSESQPKQRPMPIARGEYNVQKLIADIGGQNNFLSNQGKTPTYERETLESYSAHLDVDVHLPTAVASWGKMIQLQPNLGALLPELEAHFASASVSPFFHALNREKLFFIENSLLQFTSLPRPDKFFDCDTILEFQHEPSQTRFLFISGRFHLREESAALQLDPTQDPVVDYNPLTTYRWPISQEKASNAPQANATLETSKALLAALEKEYAIVGLPKERNRALEASIARRKAELAPLKTFAHLNTQKIPFIVLPQLFRQYPESPCSLKIGDLAVLIYRDTVLPVIFGDETVGDYRVGKISSCIANVLSGYAMEEKLENQAKTVQTFELSLLVFPGSAEAITGEPDLETLYENCSELLKKIGLHTEKLCSWLQEEVEPQETTIP